MIFQISPNDWHGQKDFNISAETKQIAMASDKKIRGFIYKKIHNL